MFITQVWRKIFPTPGISRFTGIDPKNVVSNRQNQLSKELDLSRFRDFNMPFETTMVIHSPQTLATSGMEIYVAKLGSQIKPY